jgi:hypothetical protein
MELPVLIDRRAFADVAGDAAQRGRSEEAAGRIINVKPEDIERREG